MATINDLYTCTGYALQFFAGRVNDRDLLATLAQDVMVENDIDPAVLESSFLEVYRDNVLKGLCQLVFQARKGKVAKQYKNTAMQVKFLQALDVKLDPYCAAMTELQKQNVPYETGFPYKLYGAPRTDHVLEIEKSLLIRSQSGQPLPTAIRTQAMGEKMAWATVTCFRNGGWHVDFECSSDATVFTFDHPRTSNGK